MIDLERKLREELDRRASDVSPSPPENLPDHVARRVRRRQASLIAASIVVIAALSLGSLGAVRFLQAIGGPREDHQVPAGPVEGQPTLVAAGEHLGRPWRVVVVWDGSDWCLEHEIPKGRGGACGLEVPPGDLSAVSNRPRGFPTFVYGAVSKQVARVTVRFDDGSSFGPGIVEPPPDRGIPFNAFVLAVDVESPGRVVVFDDGGTRLASDRILPPPPLPIEGGISLNEGSGSEESTPRDRGLITALVQFARAPSHETWSEVPFNPEAVWLGLGDRLILKRSPDELADPAAWVLDLEDFRAQIGPFSALDMLADAETIEVSVGPHPHCASPPEPPPEGMEDLRRVSAQPGDIDTCVLWWTVDAFVAADGTIAAVTLDLWEP